MANMVPNHNSLQFLSLFNLKIRMFILHSPTEEYKTYIAVTLSIRYIVKD